jgi:riboflavin synthase
MGRRRRRRSGSERRGKAGMCGLNAVLLAKYRVVPGIKSLPLACLHALHGAAFTLMMAGGYVGC